STSDDNVIDITPKDNEEKDTLDSDLCSMPSDDLASLTGFETLDSDDVTSIYVNKEHSADNLNVTSDGDVDLPYASAEELTQVEAQGEKWDKNNPQTPKDTKVHQTDVQEEQLVAKENTKTVLVTHKSEEKKSEGVLSEEDDSDEDDLDKQPL
nr:hypothetical protein [Tanacetum cinerariifolium]